MRQVKRLKTGKNGKLKGSGSKLKTRSKLKLKSPMSAITSNVSFIEFKYIGGI